MHAGTRKGTLERVARSHSELAPHPDRLFPAEPGVRATARMLYESVQDLPLISPHGHVEARLLAEDTPFPDPASLLVTPDHYVTRLLHAQGISLPALGIPDSRRGEPLAEPRDVWRAFCTHWPLFLGTASRQWIEDELHGVLDLDVQPSAANADELFDRLSVRLAEPEFRPRALFASFNIAVLATTDDPCDDLRHHRALAEDPEWTGRVVPTFRPDRYLDATAAEWPAALDRLAEVSGIDTGDYSGLISALESRRAYFRANGATATDHSAPDARMEFLDPGEAARLFHRVRSGSGDAELLSRQLLGEMARMSSEDGLVLALHTGVLRGHHSLTRQRFGPDTGHDIPVGAEFTRALRPMLERFGTDPRFQTVLFTVDETVFSRELAPLAGFYPSVYLGAPWWFLDAPSAMHRFRRAVTETAGFSRGCGFVDDTRGFCSIPARHDVARRVDAGYLAELVGEHVLGEQDALDVIHQLTALAPVRAFRL